MGFISWHYSKGLDHYITGWSNQFKWIKHYFSLPLLLKTLFSPWRRMIMIDKTPGFDFQKFFEVLSFNIVSRVVGFMARVTLFFAGIILILLTLSAGTFGFIIWVFIPILSYPAYVKYQRRPSEYVKNMYLKMKEGGIDPLNYLLGSDFGNFCLSHLGLDSNSLVKITNKSVLNLESQKFESTTQIVDYILKSGAWNKDDLRRIGTVPDDFLLLAKWWDKKLEDDSGLTGADLGRPSLGLQILFGYTPTLNQFSVDLSTPQSFSHRLIGREEIVSRMERELSAGNSIVLTGDPGVGKKTVVLEFAHRAVTGKFGSKMAYKRVLEFDYNFILSESLDINQKKIKLSQILEEASYAGNIILMIRDIHRLIHPDLEGFDFTDIFETYLEKRELKIIAVSTPIEYERFIAPNLRLRKFLQRVEVVPPTKEQAMEILIEVAKNLEVKNKKLIQMTALRKIMDESDRYITETPFPEKALELLEQIVTYVETKGKNDVVPDDVNAVFAEKTGISLAKLTSSEKERLSNLETIIHQQLVDQDLAVNQIAQSLRAKTIGGSESQRPIGSFLFLGPTGVGKTETAKVLARVYYGDEESILRFDMAEFAGGDGMERLVGSTARNMPGTLVTAIKNKPASLLLLDEFEKASREIFNLFLTLLDEGYITDSFGKRIVGRNLFVVGTSNAGAEYIRQLVNKGVRGSELQKNLVNYVLEKRVFSPELLNRFDGVIVYEPLGEKEQLAVANLMMQRYAESLRKKGFTLKILPETVSKLARDGHDPAFGARPMRRIVDLVFGDLVGKAILNKEIADGDTITIHPGAKKDEYSIEKT